MSIAERLFPPSELEAVRDSLYHFAEARRPSAQVDEATSAKEAKSQESAATSSDSCAYLVLVQPEADAACSNAVYVLDKDNFAECQRLLSAAQKVETSELSQQSGRDLLTLLSLPQDPSKAKSSCSLRSGKAAQDKLAAPRTILDEQTADKLLSMPLITDVEKDMLVSLIPSLLARANRGTFQLETELMWNGAKW